MGFCLETARQSQALPVPCTKVFSEACRRLQRSGAKRALNACFTLIKRLLETPGQLLPASNNDSTDLSLPITRECLGTREPIACGHDAQPATVTFCTSHSSQAHQANTCRRVAYLVPSARAK